MTPEKWFLHTLALQLGRTVAELKSALSVSEFFDWLEFYKIEPFGDQRGDVRIADLKAMYANAHRDEEKQREPFSPSDFLPFSPPEPEYEPGEDEVFVSPGMLRFMRE